MRWRRDLRSRRGARRRRRPRATARRSAWGVHGGACMEVCAWCVHGGVHTARTVHGTRTPHHAQAAVQTGAPAPAGHHLASLQEPALHRGALCGESQRGRQRERGACRRHTAGQLQDGGLVSVRVRVRVRARVRVRVRVGLRARVRDRVGVGVGFRVRVIRRAVGPYRNRGDVDPT